MFLIGFVLYKNPKTLLNRLCALSLIPFSIWSFGFIFFHSSVSLNDAKFWMNVASLGWCSFPITTFWFYLSFTQHEKLLRNRVFITICILIAMFFIYMQWSGNLIDDYIRQTYGWVGIWKVSLTAFAFVIYYFFFVVCCIYLAFNFGRKTKTIREKKQARVFYTTPIISLFFGSMTDIVLPMLEIYTVPPLAIIFILIWVGGLVYSITIYGLMTFTPAAAAEDILSTMNDSLLLVGLDGKILSANKMACSLLGYTKEGLKGKEFSLIASGIDVETILKLREIHNQEICYLTKRGEYIPVLFSASAVRDREEEVVGIVVTALDITERKKMEQDLRASEEKYRSLVDHALIGIGIHQNARIVFANKKLATMLGYTLEEFIGSSIAEMIHPDERNIIMNRAQKRYIGFIEPETYEIRLLKKDNSVLYTLISNTVINYIGRAATLITVADMTDTKVRRELELANKELEAFSYSVSHDLRAPLRTIDGFSQALLEDYADKLDDQGKKYLMRVRAAIQRMSQLINDLLNLSRISRSEIHYKEVNLTAIAEDIVAELKGMQPERNVEFIIEQNIKAYGDSRLLRIVLENLLSNAWKFTSKHKSAKIEFGVKQNNGKTIYFVRDDGAGFDMTYVDKLFTPFQRLHETSEFEGTGIGLATVQRIIQRHGGVVWAEGEVEKGATFYFTLQL